MYNTSATFLWVGERTRQLDGAHLEYLRGLRNPIGIKIGPSTTPVEVLTLLELLCGDNPSEPGRVTLIFRFGADKVSTVLPPILQAVKNSQFNPVWMCDPCHGNTISRYGVKTRSMATMLGEVKQVIAMLAAHGMHLGGLHLEQTGEEDVLECVETEDFGEDVKPGENYKSLCDPRLSGAQARTFVARVAEMLVAVERPNLKAGAKKKQSVLQIAAFAPSLTWDVFGARLPNILGFGKTYS